MLIFFYVTLWQYYKVKKIVLVLSIFFSYGYAIAENQYSYEDLIEIQTVLLDSYSSASDESIAISLSNVS